MRLIITTHMSQDQLKSYNKDLMQLLEQKKVGYKDGNVPQASPKEEIDPTK